MKAIKKIIAIVLVLVTVFAAAAMAEEPAAETAPAAEITEIQKITVSTTGNVNLRETAGKNGKILKVLKKGATAEKIGETKDERGVIWYEVKLENGKTGFISSAYAKLTGARQGKVKTTARLNLRDALGTKAKVLSILGKAATFSFDEARADAKGIVWYHITAGKLTGWICGEYVKEI